MGFSNSLRFRFLRFVGLLRSYIIIWFIRNFIAWSAWKFPVSTNLIRRIRISRFISEVLLGIIKCLLILKDYRIFSIFNIDFSVVDILLILKWIFILFIWSIHVEKAIHSILTLWLLHNRVFDRRSLALVNEFMLLSQLPERCPLGRSHTFSFKRGQWFWWILPRWW